MQRICFCKTVSLFNHILQPSQALALFYQSLIFSLKNLTLIRWISSNVDIPIGLQLLMIDINGNVTIDDELFYKQLLNSKCDGQQQTDTLSILKWISRIILRLATDCSVSSKLDRSHEFETFNEFLKQFLITSTDDRSIFSEDDEGIIDDLDKEDLSRRLIYRALIKCIDYTTTNSLNTLNSNSNTTEMQDFENNSIALYNQQIIQILCSDTLELEIELARDSRQSSLEFFPQTSTNDNTLINYYSVWAALWRDVTIEYLQFNNKKSLRKVTLDNFKNENHRWSLKENDRVLDEIAKRQQNLKKPIIKSNEIDENNFCLHDRLMFEIQQKKRLKSIEKSLTPDSNRKKIRPIKNLAESDFSSDDEYERKRVAVVDCLLQSSSSSSPDDKIENNLIIKNVNENNDEYIYLSTDNKISTKKMNYPTKKNLELEHISMEKLLRLMKDSSDTLSLTFNEFCHIRNVITRAELETLLFDEKLYAEVAQSKLCFTCRKVHFNLLTFTFGIQCNVCKQKVCRNCITQIALPKERLNDLPIKAFTSLTLTKPLLKSERWRSLDTQSPLTPTMNHVSNDANHDGDESRRCSTPNNNNNQSNSNKWETEPIDICTDCFFLLQQIRKKSRQRHISPAITSNLASSSSFNRSRHSSSRSTSNYNLSSSSSASSIAALLAQQQQQRSLIVKTTSIHGNLKTAKSVQELSTNNNPLQTLATIATTNGPTAKVSLSRRHLFLKLQPAYDVKLNNIKTGY